MNRWRWYGNNKVYQRAIQLFLNENGGKSWWETTCETRRKYHDRAVKELICPSHHSTN